MIVDRDFIEARIKETADSGYGTFVLNMSGYPVTGQDYSRLFLPYSEWRGSHLASVNLCMARLNCASFDDAHLVACMLDGAILQEATGFRATLTQCSLMHTELVRATFYAARISYCMLDGANLNGANLELARISDSTFSQLTVEETGEMICTDLRGAKLRGAEITSCDFKCASLAGADLHGAIFRQCSLFLTSFIGANTEGTQFIDCVPQIHHAIWDQGRKEPEQ